MFLEMFFTVCFSLRVSTLEGTIDEQLSVCFQRLFKEAIKVNLSFLDFLGPIEKAFIPVGKAREKARFSKCKNPFLPIRTRPAFGFET